MRKESCSRMSSLPIILGVTRDRSFQEWSSCQFVVTDYNCAISLSSYSFQGSGGFCWKTYIYLLELSFSLIYQRKLFVLRGARLKGIPEIVDLVLYNWTLLYPDVHLKLWSSLYIPMLLNFFEYGCKLKYNISLPMRVIQFLY